MSTVSTVPGGAGTFSSASGGKIYAYNTVGNVSNLTVAPANPARQKIRFHNPGTVDIYISPTRAYVTASITVLSPLIPTTSALGGVFTVYANGGTLEITGECQGPWQALAASGTTNPLTVMDSNL